jgi:hypothetical protein
VALTVDDLPPPPSSGGLTVDDLPPPPAANPAWQRPADGGQVDVPSWEGVKMFGRAVRQIPERIGAGLAQGGATIADAATGLLAKGLNTAGNNVAGVAPQYSGTNLTGAVSRQLDPVVQQWNQTIAPGDPTLGSVAGQGLAGLASIPVLGAGGAADTLTGALARNALLGAASTTMNYEQGADFSQKLKEAVEAGGVAGVLGTAGAIAPAARNRFAEGLQNLAANASARIQGRVNDLADLVGSQNVTVQHTLQNPVADRLAAGTAGAGTREAQAVLDDAAIAGYQKKAEAMSAAAVKAPELAQGASDALETRDTNLKARGGAAYTAGEARVKLAQAQAPNQQLPFPQLTQTAKDIQKEVGDIYNLDPSQLTPRTQQLLDFLKLNILPEQPLIGTNGAPIIRATPVEAMKLSKGINTLYTDTNKVLPTKDVVDVNGVYSRLKTAYEADLAAMPTSPSVQAIRDTNAAYKEVQDARQQLRASAVAGAFGKDNIGDPDAMLDKLTSMNPSAAAYARRTLEAYDPETLQGIKRYALERQISKAYTPGGITAGSSEFDVGKLDPGSLLKSGLYSADEVASLQKAANALSLINASRATSFSTGAPQLKELGRVVASMNPTFLSGIAAHALGTGKIERLLTTPEGRTLLTDVLSTSKVTGTAARVAIARMLIGEMQMPGDNQQMQPQQ